MYLRLKLSHGDSIVRYLHGRACRMRFSTRWGRERWNRERVNELGQCSGIEQLRPCTPRLHDMSAIGHRCYRTGCREPTHLSDEVPPCAPYHEPLFAWNHRRCASSKPKRPPQIRLLTN